MEREKICANGYCEAECPCAIVKEEYEPHQSMLGQYEGELFKATSVRNEENVWKVFCKALGEEKFLDMFGHTLVALHPKRVLYLCRKIHKQKRRTFGRKQKNSSKSKPKRAIPAPLRILLINIFLKDFFIYLAYDKIDKILNK